jgi:2-polyprenyl-3-methyl-5-hydroxy-6-metoxy-1,4-benzoquinol methylase
MQMTSDACQRNVLAEKITMLMREHYTHYYLDRLGLPDWERRVETRLSEDENVLRFITWVETWFNEHFREGKKVLVVGGGTGAEFIALSKRGCGVYAIEPNQQAVKIGQLKARLLGVDPARFMQGYSEELPFASNTFDFVWCLTVLEHVQDVRMCISEMIRVTTHLGRVFIVAPDYRQFYEPHYKITMPMFAPKWILRLWLLLMGRPVEFLSTLQLINSKFLTNIFQDHPVTAFQIIHSWPEQWKSNPTIRMRLVKWMTKHFGIQRDQYWLLQKLEMPR